MGWKVSEPMTFIVDPRVESAVQAKAGDLHPMDVPAYLDLVSDYKWHDDRDTGSDMVQEHLQAGMALGSLMEQGGMKLFVATVNTDDGTWTAYILAEDWREALDRVSTDPGLTHLS